MQKIIFHWLSLLAAFSLYTRLPAWRLGNLETKHYSCAIRFLPIVGFFTGGLMILVFYWANTLAGLSVLSSVILTLASRILLTAGFHEDGLGDFFDGFGGGRDRETVLRIMKDSHTGSYAIIGYIFYYALYFSLITSLPKELIPIALFCSDILGKSCNQLQVVLLKYARRDEESKTKIVYKPSCWLTFITLPFFFGFMFSLLPWYYIGLPLGLSLGIILYINKRIGGYTGDTCGALILLTELSGILSFALSK